MYYFIVYYIALTGTLTAIVCVAEIVNPEVINATTLTTNISKYILEFMILITDLAMFGFFLKQFICLNNFISFKIQKLDLRNDMKTLS